MPDREKVIRAVETCFDSWIDKHRDMGLDLHEVERMKRDALELLKNEYEFVKVKHHDISNADDTTFDDEFWCEGCGTVWQMAKEETNFCPHCGRAVKWND